MSFCFLDCYAYSFFLSLLDTIDVRYLLISNLNTPANGNPCMGTEQPMRTPYFTLAAQLEQPKQSFFRVVRSSMLHDYFQSHPEQLGGMRNVILE
jgi:hypothetical protein